MRFSRDMQWQFLEEELKAEVKEFDDKLKTSATHLMEKGLLQRKRRDACAVLMQATGP